MNKIELLKNKLQKGLTTMSELNIENCKDYLDGMYFKDIRFNGQKEGSMCFLAIDEDDQEKEIKFQPMEDGKVCVSVKEDEQWSILKVLED